MILMMIIVIVIITAIMIMMIKIILIIAVVIIINSPVEPSDFSTGSTTVCLGFCQTFLMERFAKIFNDQ